MKQQEPLKSRLPMFLTGTLAQFNISLLLLSALLLISLYWCLHSSNIYVFYGGSSLFSCLIIICFIFVIRYYNRQELRPPEGQNSLLKIKSPEGSEITFRNPPDNTFKQERLSEIFRLLMIGYDDDLCPDGNIVGSASDGKIVKLTEEEKQKFIKEHKAEIAGKREISSLLLSEIDDAENQVEQVSNNDTPKK